MSGENKDTGTGVTNATAMQKNECIRVPAEDRQVTGLQFWETEKTKALSIKLDGITLSNLMLSDRIHTFSFIDEKGQPTDNEVSINNLYSVSAEFGGKRHNAQGLEEIKALLNAAPIGTPVFGYTAKNGVALYGAVGCKNAKSIAQAGVLMGILAPQLGFKIGTLVNGTSVKTGCILNAEGKEATNDEINQAFIEAKAFPKINCEICVTPGGGYMGSDSVKMSKIRAVAKQ